MVKNISSCLFLRLNLETPLSLASIELTEPREMLMTLVNGGAHLDFRTRSGGLTALHYASIHQRKESILVCDLNR